MSMAFCCPSRRMLKMMETGPMPFDDKRMAYGGFRVLVDL
jgi:uncharacterized protein YbaA (DUF1428 family)